MTAWTAEELDRIGGADELEIAARRSDGSLRRPVPIWVIRVGEELYVRSWRGQNGGWFRTARSSHEGHITVGGLQRDVALHDADVEVNDAVYRAKYGRYPSYVPPMLTPQARATTLRLVAQHRDGQP